MAQANHNNGSLLEGRRFWIIQLLVWTAFAVLEFYQIIEFRRANDIAIEIHDVIKKSMIPTVPGLVITSVFRLLFVRIAHWEERQFIAAAVGACLIGSVVFAYGQYEMKWLTGYYSHSQWSNWRNWLAYAPSRLVILGAWTSVYVSIVFLSEAMRHRARTKELETAAAKARSEMLRYQVNPHLLFNALNTVSGHVLNNDLPSADKAIQSLSRLLRFSLSDGEAASINLEQEIFRVKLYLDVEQTRFGDELQIAFDIAEDMKSVELPPLLLQPLVENAMKHGLARSTKGGSVSISARTDSGDGVIVVRNEIPENGVMESTDDQKVCFGLGLKNVEERLAMFFDGPTSLSIIEKTKHAFSVELRFPHQAESEDD